VVSDTVWHPVEERKAKFLIVEVCIGIGCFGEWDRETSPGKRIL